MLWICVVSHPRSKPKIDGHNIVPEKNSNFGYIRYFSNRLFFVGNPKITNDVLMKFLYFLIFPVLVPKSNQHYQNASRPFHVASRTTRKMMYTTKFSQKNHYVISIFQTNKTAWKTFLQKAVSIIDFSVKRHFTWFKKSYRSEKIMFFQAVVSVGYTQT